MREQVVDETQAASVTDEENGAPVATEEAASTDSGAPAGPPEGYIEQTRYDELRGEFNRKNALLDRALRGDAEAARELGFEFAEDEQQTDSEDDENAAFQDPRVDQLLQERAQEREQAIIGDVSGHIDTLLQEANVELPQRLKNAILSEAWLRGGGAQIQPQTTVDVVKEWVDEYKQLQRSAGDSYIKSKRASHVSPGGTGATDDVLPPDATHAQRVAWMTQRLGLSNDI